MCITKLNLNNESTLESHRNVGLFAYRNDPEKDGKIHNKGTQEYLKMGHCPVIYHKERKADIHRLDLSSLEVSC